jgi:hypothetical protein
MLGDYGGRSIWAKTSGMVVGLTRQMPRPYRLVVGLVRLTSLRKQRM